LKSDRKIWRQKSRKKHYFSKEEKDAYLQELENYMLTVQDRAEKVTMIRAADYSMQEFSDPVYIL